jgi:hypothetical protein
MSSLLIGGHRSHSTVAQKELYIFNKNQFIHYLILYNTFRTRLIITLTVLFTSTESPVAKKTCAAAGYGSPAYFLLARWDFGRPAPSSPVQAMLPLALLDLPPTKPRTMGNANA